MKPLFKVIFFLTISMSVMAQQVPPAVQRAHEAYLRGDGRTLVMQIKTALEQSGGQKAIQNNMLDLYKAAFRNGLLKNVEPNWSLPKEVIYAAFESQRRFRAATGRVSYFLSVSFGIESGAELEQLQVVRYPSQIIFDKAANIGDWQVEPKGRQTDFWAGTEQSVDPNEEGLYLLNLQIKGQPMVQAWFVFTNKNSSASPVVNFPKPGQALMGSQPLFKWNAFQSPEFQKGEGTKIDFKVNQAGGNEPAVCQLRLLDSQATSYRFGDKNSVKDFMGPETLTAGSYNLSIVYREFELFGGIQLRRTSSTKVPFSIK